MFSVGIPKIFCVDSTNALCVVCVSVFAESLK